MQVDSRGSHDLDLNAGSQLALLETLRSTGAKPRIVYTSTRQVYGRPRYNPVDEEHPAVPVDVNGIAKLAGEQLHLLYSDVHKIPATALRLTNVYGQRQRLRGDDQGFLPIFFRRAFEGQPITVYGDGDQVRDCLHVDDAVGAIVAAALVDDAIGEVINVGHHGPTTVRAIADAIVDEVGNGQVISVPWPKERSQIDIGSFASDVSKAKRLLGWEASIDIDEGVSDTVAFYRSRLGTYL